jgi:hypothetical protein
MNMVIIELPEPEAELFKRFREHQAQFETLMTGGVFDVRKGQAILSFSNEGTITDIDIHVKAFVRKRA